MIGRLIHRIAHRSTMYGAGFFNDSWFFNWERLKCTLKDLIATIPKWHSILDFGCGPGVMIDLMNEAGYNYIGFDNSIAAKSLYIQNYGKYPDRFLLEMDQALDQPYDLFLAFDVFEHLTDDQIKDIISATEGIPDYFLNISRNRSTPGHINIKSDKKWINFLESTGLRLNDSMTDFLRKSYADLHSECPDLWNKNIFLFSK